MPGRRQSDDSRMASMSIGLEDEQSFGSDEDLLDVIGEIEIPTADIPPKSKLRRSTKQPSSPSMSHKSSKTRASLASASLVLLTTSTISPQHSSSTLTLELAPELEAQGIDRPKRGSLMGAFKIKKGLRKWRDDQSSKGTLPSSTRSSSSLHLHEVKSNNSLRPSFQTISTQSSVPPHLSLPSLEQAGRNSMSAESFEPKTPRTSDTIAPRKVGASWDPSAISSAILPVYPATLTSLEPITAFTTQASTRSPLSTLPSSPSSPRWTPCTLVFTKFKVTLAGADAVLASGSGADLERTVAHVHIFASQRQPNPSSAIRRAKTSTGPFESSFPRIEMERRSLSRDSTASIYDHYPDGEGRRVLSIYFGDQNAGKGANEWILDMKDDIQLHEWIRQIKKTAIMINAEELGYGSAIRPDYEDMGMSADELAKKLSVHARSVAEARENEVKEKTVKGVAPKSLPPKSATPKAKSLAILPIEEFSPVQSMRSISAVSEDDGPEVCLASPSTSPASDDGVAPTAGRMRRNTFGRSASTDSLTGLTVNGISLGNVMFPLPPSDLPRVPTGPASPIFGKFESSSVPPSLSSHASSNSASPNMVPTPGANVESPTTLDGLLKEQQAPTTQVTSNDSDEICLPNAPQESNANEVFKSSTPTISPPSPSITPSIISQTSTSGTARLRRLRGKPQVIDIMTEFTQIEADSMPPAEDEEPIREDRERRIRFAE